MNDEQFQKILKLMQHFDERFDGLEAKIDKEFDEVKNVLDKHTGMLDTDELERLALQKQVDRHEAWIDAAARKLSTSSQV